MRRYLAFAPDASPAAWFREPGTRGTVGKRCGGVLWTFHCRPRPAMLPERTNATSPPTKLRCGRWGRPTGAGAALRGFGFGAAGIGAGSGGRRGDGDGARRRFQWLTQGTGPGGARPESAPGAAAARDRGGIGAGARPESAAARCRHCSGRRRARPGSAAARCGHRAGRRAATLVGTRVRPHRPCRS